MKPISRRLFGLTLFVPIAACGGSDGDPSPPAGAPDPSSSAAAPQAAPAAEHAHDEQPLGAATIGDLEVELAQGHGPLVAGEEAHLVVKLPYSDGGATVVRAWIGTQDRTASYVGKGEYARAHDDYDVHATAPDPLPADPLWWIELETPGGTKLLGSAKPITAGR